MDRILVSHSWGHPEQHGRLKDLLNRNGLEYYDHSITPDKPLWAYSEQHLKSQISDRIGRVSSVIVLATEDIHKKPLVIFEIQEALRQGKRVVGVKPWGDAYGPIPKILSQEAHAIVGFRSDQIASAVSGENIRNMSEYPISEMEDILDAAHWIVRSAGCATLVLSVSAECLIPRVNTVLSRYGYSIQVSGEMPTGKRFLKWVAIGGGIGALVGLFSKNKRTVSTLAIVGAAIGAGSLVVKSLSLSITRAGGAIAASYTQSE